MAYEAKTDWLPDTEIREDDLNRWEQGIDDAHNELDSHKNDQANPHRVTKSQVGLGNVDDVQQASKEDFDSHKNNINNPHRVNSTQINVITARDAAAKYSEYPKGITIAETGTGKSMGYPWDFILIETEQLGANRTVQTIYDMSSSTVIRSMVRKYREADGGWGDWAKAETEAAAQEKAIQALEAAKKYTVDNAQMHKLTQDNGHVINSDANLDDIKTTGVYFSKGAQGSPEAGKWGFLVVITQDTGRRKQIWRHDKTAINYERSWKPDTNTWSDWAEIETTAGAQLKADKAREDAIWWSKTNGLGEGAENFVDDGADLDTIVNSGFYRLQRGSNFPAKEAEYGQMIVSRAGGASIAQMVFPYAIAKIYIRTGNPAEIGGQGDWTEWAEIETTAGAQAKADAVQEWAEGYGLGAAAPNADWNAIRKTGFYRGNVNGPMGGSVVMGVTIMHSDTYATQIVGRVGRTFQRNMEGGVWREWVELETKAGAQDKADRAEINAKNALNSHANNENNPHGVTSQQVNETAERAANVAGTDYPKGVSYFSTASGSSLGYPANLGTVHTVNDSDYRIFQQFMESSSSGNKFYYRNYRSNEGWSNWSESETTAGAQSKATQAESNAINAARSYGLGSDGLKELMNLNDASKTGWRSFGSNAVNAPRAANGVVETILSGPNDGIQKAYLTGSRVEFLRRKEAGTWSSWIQTAGNQEEGWRELTPRGGSQIYSEAAKPMVMRQGDMVMVRGALTGINSRGFLALTLPGDCRPAKDTPALTNISIGSDYHARFARWTIKTNGDIIMEYTIDNTFDARWWSVEMVFSMGG